MGMTIATQAGVGAMGRKPTTMISWSFYSLVNTGDRDGFQYGLNENGITLLNTGTDDDGTPFTAEFTLNTSDYGIQQEKKIWYLYFAFEGDEDFTVSLKCDDDQHGFTDYPAVAAQNGLQRIRVQTGRGRKGLFWRCKVSSRSPFKISRISAHVKPLTRRGFR